jgi:hypothetical protein
MAMTRSPLAPESAPRLPAIEGQNGTHKNIWRNWDPYFEDMGPD